MTPLSLYEQLMVLVRQPEYLHVLLHPIPIYGAGFGVLGLLLGLWMKSRPAQVVALVLLLVSGLSAWPVKELGENSCDAIEAISDKSAYAWLDAHGQRAEKGTKVFYLLAAFAAVALVVPAKLPRLGMPLSVITLLVAVAALLVGGWIAYAGGKIRHKEFRHGPPPEKVGEYEKMR